jgi:Protein of unknown function (DUF3667)
VSHRQERTEKDCLNCGTNVQGRYCHVCGQENVLVKESFGHLVKHFLYDITHFDSKFFDSVRFLLFRPGFLPKEYMQGRRASYINPIKMYVFTSAIFFIIFFSLLKVDKGIRINLDNELTAKERGNEIRIREEKIAKGDSAAFLKVALQMLQDTTTPLTWNRLNSADPFSFFTQINNRKYYSLKGYDSVQNSLPSEKRDGWLIHGYARKILKYRDENRHDFSGGLKNMFSHVLHKLPVVLFVSLPLFALILKLLYVRRKRFYYEDHAIFSVYHYVFSFLLLLMVAGFSKLNDLTGWSFFGIMIGLLFLAGGYYLYKSMRRFYQQGRGKTLLKFLLLNIAGFISLTILFALFLLLSIFEL